ncbi:EAL domain-containing protein [Vogesella sp. LIG4]|uniref:EAL domain-containing protein n=1 Tax=Vogesella sp. LIG4 TaxID=1192162 RepID=UPI00081F8CE8|nr:EAL domain-containing response regulator [Vogesella sp. LIG4]SCK21672.1 EAL domain, c-di-GMP-specific phosphodiesterase class I (or its enzymatically inactive variant) [Vogesella sp. LIG4]
MTDLQTVLCVEGDDTVRMLLCEELQSAGYRVLEADNARTALSLVRSERPELVICDAALPKRSGIELLEAVGADAEIAGIPFIVLTSGQAPIDPTLLPSLAPEDCLDKPVELDQLLARVAARIRRRRGESPSRPGGQFLLRQQLQARLERARQQGQPLRLALLKLDSFLALSMRLLPQELQQLLQALHGRLQPLAEQEQVYAWSDGCWAFVEQPHLAETDFDQLQQRFSVALGSISLNYTCSILRLQLDWPQAEQHRLEAAALLEACALHLNFQSAGNPRRLLHIRPGDYAAMRAARYAEHNLAQVVQNDELELLFQPRVELKSGRIIGAEALLRWPGAAIGGLSPGFFMPAAERMGLASELDRWVIGQILGAVRQLAERQQDFILSFNLSAQSLDADVPAFLLQTLQTQVQLAANIEVEVTETSMANLTPAVERGVAALKSLGVRLAVDDFGVGYASLSYLKRLRAEVIKIDRSFVTDLPHRGIDTQIVQGLVGLAQALGCVVVAEGVETRQQADTLSELGCHSAQGYFFYRPMALPELLQLLRVA